jgi:hypothetical protein
MISSPFLEQIQMYDTPLAEEHVQCEQPSSDVTNYRENTYKCVTGLMAG